MGPRAPDQSYMDFVLDHLPWLSGSLGTVFLDLTVMQHRSTHTPFDTGLIFQILLQCLCLNNYRAEYDEEEDEDHDENRPLLENQ